MSAPLPPTVRHLALGAGLAALLAHAGLLAGGVWSFEALNYDDPQVLALARQTPVGTILREVVWYAYKPVYFLSLKVDTLFGAAAPGAAHVHSLLLHALAAYLLVRLLFGITGRTWVAGGAGLLFAVHPVHVESVAWIAGRKEVLSLALVLGAHLLYRRARAAGEVRLGAPALLLLGGLAKGSVWVWPGVLLLDEALYARRERGAARGLLARWLPCALVGAGGVVLDGWIALGWGPGAVEHGVGPWALGAAMAGVHLAYLLHVLVPSGLALDYAVDPAGSWTSPAAWLGLLLALGALGLLVAGLRRRHAPATLGAGLWILGLLPFNNLWPRTTTLMADRYLYVPAVGIYVLAAWLLARRPRPRVLFLAAVLALGVLAMHRTSTFATSERVWADAVAKRPESAVGWYQRGQAAASRRSWAAAHRYADACIELEPRPEILVRAHLLRAGARFGAASRRLASGAAVDDGAFLGVLQDADRAVALAQALRGAPGVRESERREVHAEAESWRGQAFDLLGDPESAREAFRRAVSLAPAEPGPLGSTTWAACHHNLATTLAKGGGADALAEAERLLVRALAFRPDFLDANLQLATVRALRGDLEGALAALDRAEAHHGRTPEVLVAQAQVHLAAGKDAVRAEALLREAQRVAPGDDRASRLLADLHLTYGRYWLEEGRQSRDRKTLQRALERFESALEVQPRRLEGHLGVGDVLLELTRFAEARLRYRRALASAGDVPWLARLAARAGVLDAARAARHAASAEAHREAARRMARAVAPPVDALDLGVMAYRGELALLREAGRRLAEPGPEGDMAAAVLEAAALAATGEEEGALARVTRVLLTLGPADPERDVFDAALLLRGMLHDRRKEAQEALGDYRLLRDRRPEDPVARLRELDLALRAALVRLQTAASAGESEDALAGALAEVGAISADVLALADAHPDRLGPGLLAVEAEMRVPRWVDALRRLNELRERFPRSPEVYRGEAHVYEAQYAAMREPALLRQAARAIQRARALDPRDPRVSLDAANVARLAGEIPRAISHLERARSLELAAAGDAARQLVALHVALGRQALETGNVQEALAAAERARAVDPGAAAPWILRGEVLVERTGADARRLDEAQEAFRMAKELEPYSEAASRGLARVHRRRAIFLRVYAAAERPPSDPRGDAERWAGLDPEERAEALRAWEEETARARARIEEIRARELRELEAALRLDPGAEEADGVRDRIAELRPVDPEARRNAFLAADERYERGRDRLRDGDPLGALAAFQEAIDRYPDHALAHLFTVATIYDLLLAPPGGSEEERRLVARWTNVAFDALQALDSLDAGDRFLERHRYRGLLHDLAYRRTQSGEARLAAVRAYRRYLRAAEAAERPPDEKTETVRARVRALERGDGD